MGTPPERPVCAPDRGHAAGVVDAGGRGIGVEELENVADAVHHSEAQQRPATARSWDGEGYTHGAHTRMGRVGVSM